LGGGLDELSSPTDVPIRGAIKLENWRVSEDGKSKEKRKGLTKLDSIYNFGEKKIFGTFGITEQDQTKIAAFLEDKIWLKSGAQWTELFSPTKQIDRPVSVVKDKGLTFIAGYEKPITIKENSAFYSGIEAPQTAPTVGVQSATTDEKILEYPDSNQDYCGALRSLAAQTLLAQSFKISSSNQVTKVTLKLRKRGSPTGNVWVEIHSSQAGTSGTKNASTNIVGQGSDNINVSTIATSYTSYNFTFSGTKPSLSANTTYYLVLYGDFAVSTTNYVDTGFDSSSASYSDGRYWEINGSYGWNSYGDSISLVFEVYGTSTFTGEVLSYGALETGDYQPLNYPYTTNLLNAQSFKLSAATEVSKIKIAIKKQCFYIGWDWLCPTGNLWAEIHSSQVGTSPTKGASTNIVGQPSADVSIAGINEYYEWVEFNFTGTKPSLSAATTYYLVIYGSYVQQPTNNYHVRWTEQVGSYTDGKNWVVDNSMVWHEIGSNEDQSFKIIGTQTGEGVIATYAFSNIDDIKELRQTTATALIAQAFTVDVAYEISKVKLYLSKQGTPATNVWAEIHKAQGGTSLTKGASTNIVGGASDNVAITGISAFPTYGWITFTFSGTKPSLSSGTTYYLVLYGDYTIDGTNYVYVGQDKIDPTFESGERWDISSALVWTKRESIDLIFEIYALTAVLNGDYSFRVTFYRGGNYPCESNPSPASAKVTITSSPKQQFILSNIPISSEEEVTARRIYRTNAGGAIYFWDFDILDNTTTTVTDSHPDDSLGEEVSYESYPPPEGDMIEFFDERLWVSGVPEHPEALFPSRLGYPEQFPSPATDYFPLREDETEKIVRHKEFKNSLYAFKANSIWVVSRSGDFYETDRIVTGKGLGAAASLVECDNNLIFLSNLYKIEIFDGVNFATPRLTDKARETLESINKDFAYRSTAENYVLKSEYRLAIPTGTSQVPDKVIVYNYLTGNIAVDKYHQKICSINSVDITGSERVMIYGTEKGQIYKVDENAVKDDDQAIEATYKTGWIGDETWTILRRFFLDFILSSGKSMIFKIYKNFSQTPALTKTINGSTPTGADPTLRDVIHQIISLAVQGNYFSFEFINVDDPEELKILDFILYIKKRHPRGSIKAA
jgi:hypothetical protein